MNTKQPIHGYTSIIVAHNWLPPAPPECQADDDDLTTRIMMALDGKALKGDTLAKAVGVSRRWLYKSGHLSLLIDKGKVIYHKRSGYYRPDAPPAKMA